MPLPIWSGQHRDFFTYGRHDLAHDFTTLPEIKGIKHRLYFLPLFKKKGKRLTQTHLLEGWQLKRNDLAGLCLFMVRTPPGLFYL